MPYACGSMKCKKTFDARTLSHDALEQLRRSAVKRVAAGESPEFVAAGLGINRRAIYRWLAAYHYGGEDALKAKPIPGAPPKLDAKQLAKLAKIVREKDPRQLQFDYALWTLAMIREVIRRQFRVSLSEVSVGRLMKRLGFTPQRPLYRAWQQDAALVERWQTDDYPQICLAGNSGWSAAFRLELQAAAVQDRLGVAVGLAPSLQAPSPGAAWKATELSKSAAMGRYTGSPSFCRSTDGSHALHRVDNLVRG